LFGELLALLVVKELSANSLHKAESTIMHKRIALNTTALGDCFAHSQLCIATEPRVHHCALQLGKHQLENVVGSGMVAIVVLATLGAVQHLSHLDTLDSTRTTQLGNRCVLTECAVDGQRRLAGHAQLTLVEWHCLAGATLAHHQHMRAAVVSLQALNERADWRWCVALAMLPRLLLFLFAANKSAPTARKTPR